MRVLRVIVCATLLSAAPALAQENEAAVEVTVSVTRGLAVDRPFTVVYPSTMQLVEDGDDVTIATLDYRGAPVHCDAMIGDGGTADWTADTAAANLDRPGTEAGWLEQFPAFAISAVSTVAFQSGPAMFYQGESQSSPFGVPATIFHAEAVDGGRTYIFECIADTTIAAQAKGLVDFLFANFSTRSDGECCIDPAAPRE